MSPVNRHRCIALLLLIVVSHTAFSAHIATHVTGDQSSCELCTGHGNPSHAIPMSAFGLQPPVAFILEAERVHSAESALRVLYYRQRAPPRAN